MFQDGVQIDFDAALDSDDDSFEGEVVVSSNTRICSIVSDLANVDSVQRLSDGSKFSVKTKDLALVKKNGDVFLVMKFEIAEFI